MSSESNDIRDNKATVFTEDEVSNYDLFIEKLKQLKENGHTTKDILDLICEYYKKYVSYNYDELQIVKIQNALTRHPEIADVTNKYPHNAITPENAEQIKQQYISDLNSVFMKLEGRTLTPRTIERLFSGFGTVIHYPAKDYELFGKQIHKDAYDEIKGINTENFPPIFCNGMLQEGVCAAYANVFEKRICEDLGIKHYSVEGAGTTGHAWSLIYLPEEQRWVHFDMTMVKFYQDGWIKDHSPYTEKDWIASTTEDIFKMQPTREIHSINGKSCFFDRNNYADLETILTQENQQRLREDIHISSAEMDKMQQLGRGACSNVYKYGDLAIKVLNDSGMSLHNEKEFYNMIGIENGTCVFPKSRLFLDGEFKGYSMECVQGRPAQEVIMDLNLRELIMAIQQVEEDLKQVSDRKILLKDFNQGGLMWDERTKRFKIIDTDFFEKNDNISEEQCYNKNLESFNTLIEMLLQIQNGQSNKVLQYLSGNKDYEATCHEYIKNEYAGNRPSVTVLIEKAIETFETNFGVHIDTMKDIGELVGETFERKEVDLDNIPVFVPPTGSDLLQSGVDATEPIGIDAINSAIDMIRKQQLYREEKTGPKEERL